jgi:hypothetical protein
MTAPTNLDEVLDDAIASGLYGLVHVSMPGVVQAYHRATQTADVQPIVRARQLDEEGNVTPLRLPVLPGVPVSFPQGGGCSITWDLAAGDVVLLLIAERSLDEWKATAAMDVTPADPRRFDLSDAVALAGVRSPSAPLTEVGAYLGISGPAIRLGHSLASATHAVPLGDAVKALFNAHTHQTPVGPSGPPLEGAVAAPFDNAAAASYPHLSTVVKVG